MLRISALSVLCAGLSLALTPALSPRPAQAAPAAPAGTPAVSVVRQFLADRAAGRYEAAYALLSARSRQYIPADKFAAGIMNGQLPPSDIPGMTDSLFGLLVLLTDTHNTLHDTFTVVGPDPADGHAVLVRVNPPAGASGVPAVMLRLLTATDPAAHVPRLDVYGSLERAAPKLFTGVRETPKRPSSQDNLRNLSLSIIQYAQDNGVMPDADKWVDEIMPFVKSRANFHDPSAPPGQAWSYAYNRALSHTPLAQFDRLTPIVMLFESTLGTKNASDAGESVPHPGRHSGGSYYAFADGHVKWFADGTKLSYKLSGK